MPKSKKVWLLAAQTEYNYSNKDTRRKSEILLKALEHLPTEIGRARDGQGVWLDRG